jgi:geranylgeranyl pyrophosphate synthase
MMKDCVDVKDSYDRALFVRLSNESVGGDWHKIIGALAAVELTDLSVIMTDDVLDESPRRMGRPTFHKKWGIKNAIIVSSILKSIASEELIRTAIENHLSSNKLCEALYVFEQAHKRIYIGQYTDLMYEDFYLNEVSSRKYLEMIRDTTGSQISACCAIGGIMGQGSDSEVNALKDFGLYAGLIFQIRDDLIDYIDDEFTTGKPPFGDFVRRKKRLPLIIAYKNHKNKLIKILANKNNVINCKKEIVELITSQKSLHAIRRILIELGEKALSRLKYLENKNSVRLLGELLRTGMDV